MTVELFSQYVDVICQALIPFVVLPCFAGFLFCFGSLFYNAGKTSKKDKKDTSDKSEK